MTQPRPLGVLRGEIVKAEPRQLAVVKEYDELMAALRARSDEIEMSRDGLDVIAGLPRGYVSKLLAPVPLKGIGRTSLGPLLQSLGLALIVVEDLSTFAKIEARLQRRVNKKQKKETYATAGMRPHKRYKRRAVWRGNSEWGHLMNSRAQLKMSPEQIRRQRKRAAQARWSRVNRLRLQAKTEPPMTE